jgi:glutathione synthase/RimK-type ligase-like ATP-grasp enzyme
VYHSILQELVSASSELYGFLREMKRIALATSAMLPTLNDDDRLLVPALAELGVAAVPAVWDAPDVQWDEFRGGGGAVLVRSCWDYHHRLDEFLAWLTRLERAGVPVWNPPALLRWNSHKGYLRDLAARGVPIVPTRWLARGRTVGLVQLLHDERWSDAVVKPAVSASAHGTWRTSFERASADQSRLDELLRAGDVMVQPFIDEVCDPGEWSLMFFGSRFSHAVRKRPAAADYRVQWEFGGTAAPLAPPPRLIADAEAVMAAVPGHPLYARVDGVERDGRLMLMELELIEPHLFLGWDADASGRLASVLAAFVSRP